MTIQAFSVVAKRIHARYGMKSQPATALDLPERDHRDRNEDVERDDVNERPARRAGREEEQRPREVQSELDGVEDQRCAHVGCRSRCALRARRRLQ